MKKNLVTKDYLFDPDIYVYNCKELFKSSLDSVLLSSFFNINKKTKKVLDIGTGNGIVVFNIAKKYPNIDFTGIEINQVVLDYAIKASNEQRLNNIEFIYADVIEYSKNVDSDIYDSIVCNPPFFDFKETKRVSDNNYKAVARHEEELSLDSLLDVSKKMLKNKGSLFLVHRTNRLIDIIMKLVNHGLEPKRIKLIYSKSVGPSKTLLIEAVKNGGKNLTFESPLVIHNDDGSYTKESIEYLGGPNVKFTK